MHPTFTFMILWSSIYCMVICSFYSLCLMISQTCNHRNTWTPTFYLWKIIKLPLRSYNLLPIIALRDPSTFLTMLWAHSSWPYNPTIIVYYNIITLYQNPHWSYDHDNLTPSHEFDSLLFYPCNLMTIVNHEIRRP